MGLIDLRPAELDYVKLRRASYCQGMSLLKYLRGQARAGQNRPIFSERIVHSDEAGVDVAGQIGAEEYVKRRDSPYAYFDLAHDPGEKNNFLGTGGKRVGELAKIMREYKHANRKLANKMAGSRQVRKQGTDEETLQRLKALGYVN